MFDFDAVLTATGSTASARRFNGSTATAGPVIVSANNAITDGCHKLATTGGRVALMLRGEPAWHGLGTLVTGVVTAADALKLSGQDWRVELVPALYDANGQRMTADGFYVVVRSDTGASLGVVGDKFTPLQNVDAFQFFDQVLNGRAEYETAGALDGGRKTWILAKASRPIEPIAGDVVQPYWLLTNQHNGQGSIKVYPTTVRVVCNNTFTAAEAGRTAGISIRHTPNSAAKLADVVRAVQQSTAQLQEFAASAEVLARRRVNVEAYASEVLDVILDVETARKNALDSAIAETAAAARLERIQERKANWLDVVLANHERELPAARGTAWGAFNAFTESVDHGQEIKYRGSAAERAENRFESIVAGAAHDMKQTAYAVAMRTAAN